MRSDFQAVGARGVSHGLLVAAVLLCCGGPVSSARAQSADEYLAKAALLFNFAKFVRWPANAMPDQADFVIAVDGNSPFLRGLQIIEGKSVQGRSVQVRTYNDVHQVPDCHILIINGNAWTRLSGAERERLQERHILTVGEGAGFVEEDGILALLVVDGHLAFDVNSAAARAANLEMSAHLLRLARSFDGGIER